MKIGEVSVKYAELRSNGYPSFSNKTCGIELTASLDFGDTPRDVRARLFRAARASVVKMFADLEAIKHVEDDCREMDIPF